MYRVFKDRELNLSFLRDGFAVVDLLGPRELDQLRNLYRKFGDSQDLAVNFTIDSTNTEYRKRLHDELAAVLRQPIESMFVDYEMVGPNFVTKPAHGLHLPLHQDNAIVDERYYISANVWCITHDCDESFGVLTVVPQSHRWTLQGRCFADQLELSPFRNLIPLVHEKYQVAVPLKAGQAVIYHSRTMHGSMPNQHDVQRIATLCGNIPRETDVLFYHRHSKTEVELFRASPAFFWNDNFVHVRPAVTPSLGSIDMPLLPAYSEEQLHQVAKYCQEHPFEGIFEPLPILETFRPDDAPQVPAGSRAQ